MCNYVWRRNRDCGSGGGGASRLSRVALNDVPTWSLSVALWRLTNSVSLPLHHDFSGDNYNDGGRGRY